MIREFYDTHKRTQTEQVLKNMEDIADLQQVDEDLDDKIDEEIQNRTDADSDLAYDIADLQSQLDSLGNVFTLKGSVATYSDLPATDNHIGDVWYVVADAVGYVWIDDNGTERWEQLGLPIDLSDYITTGDLALALDDYQPKLTAGTNISIIGDTISATQPDTSKFEMLSGVSAPSTSTAGAVGQKYLDTTKSDIYVCTAITDNGDDTFSYTWLLAGGNGKQNKLTAGTNITISGDVISASGGLQSVKSSDIDSESATSGQVLTADGSGGASWQNVSASGMTNPMSTQGDIIYGGASGTPTRLAKGTAGQVLTMNSGATTPEWANPKGQNTANYNLESLMTQQDLQAFLQMLNSTSDGFIVKPVSIRTRTTIYDFIKISLSYPTNMDLYFHKSSNLPSGVDEWICTTCNYASDGSYVNTNTMIIASNETTGHIIFIHKHIA